MIFQVSFVFVLFVLFFIVFEWLVFRFKLSGAIIRKVAHFFGGIVMSGLLFFLSAQVFVLSNLIFALIFTMLSLKKVITSIHVSNYKTWGEIFYPISLAILGYFAFDEKLIMLSAIATLCFADSLAGLYDIKNKKRTIAGAMIFFVTSFVALMICSVFFVPFSVMIFTKLAIISFMVAIVEFFSYYGSDNLTVPLATAVLMKLLL